MTATPSRTPAGVPSGGQFAATARSESDVTLTLHSGGTDESELGMLVEQNRRDREASDRWQRYPESVTYGRARPMLADDSEQNLGRPPADFDTYNPQR